MPLTFIVSVLAALALLQSGCKGTFPAGGERRGVAAEVVPPPPPLVLVPVRP